MKKLLKNPYFITGLSVTLLFLILFLVKGIYPFGPNTLIYGDMHDQITAFFYHFYDVFHGDASLFVDFSTSGGINFWGILAYYILSPVSFLLLFFPREDLYLAVSLVIALKILIASLTCLYSLRVLFKEKLGFLISIILAISYAFCGYNLLMYQITPWMDSMYLFPLVAVGLKKVLDGEKPYLYIVTLTLSIIFSFYTTCMSLILILFLSFVYLVVFEKKENRPKRIASLGLSTIFSILMSLFIVLPSALQISSSYRLQIALSSVFNSKTGPLLDKLSFFIPSALLLACTLLLLINHKKHKSFLKWYLPSLVILGIPYLIEPINKMIHFLSYAYFPNRYGYMLFYLLVIGGAYYFINHKSTNEKKHASLISIITTIILGSGALLIAYRSYHAFQESMFHLTISKDKPLFLKMAIFTLCLVIAYVVLLLIKKKKDKIFKLCFASIFLIQIGTSLFLYFGLDKYQEVILPPYQALNEIEKTYKQKDYFRIKNNTSSMVTNNGMVTGYHNLDHFTSLVNGNNLKTLKQLGYHTYWTKTSSKNGTLFADSLLANQYYLTTNVKMEDWYEPMYNFTNYNMYRLNQDLSYGYFTDNIEFNENEDTFTFQNRIYQSIVKTKDIIFKIYDDFSLKNIEVKKDGEYQTYTIIDKEGTSILEEEIKITNKQVLYFNAFRSFLNGEDSNVYKSMNIYVNDKLLKSDYPSSKTSGSIYLGTFEDEVVNIKIELLNDVSFRYLKIGTMDVKLWTEFVKEQKVDSKISFTRNKILVDVSSEEGGLFFIPITYDDGYSVKVNGKKQEVVKVYDNFLGVELDKGSQTIEFKYVPKGFTPGIIISILSLIATIVIFYYNFYDKLIFTKWFNNLARVIYLIMVTTLFFFIYFVPFVCFFLSYFFRIL